MRTGNRLQVRQQHLKEAWQGLVEAMAWRTAAAGRVRATAGPEHCSAALDLWHIQGQLVHQACL